MAVDLNDIEKMEIKNVNSGKVSLFTNKIFYVYVKTNSYLGYIISVRFDLMVWTNNIMT